MPRYRAEQKSKRSEKISVISLVFPLVSVLYAEWIFTYFGETNINCYKILFSLAAGGIAVALGRITPLRTVNFTLQSVWLLFCFGMIAAQYLCFQSTGAYFSLFGQIQQTAIFPQISKLWTAAMDNIPFLFCILAPVVLQFTVQRAALLHRESLLGRLLGANWLEAPGMLLLAAILSFAGVTLAFYDAEGPDSPRRQMEIELMPAVSVAEFGVLPETVLDFKFNVLHVAEEEIINHYVITENGEQIQLSEDALRALQ